MFKYVRCPRLACPDANLNAICLEAVRVFRNFMRQETADAAADAEVNFVSETQFRIHVSLTPKSFKSRKEGTISSLWLT